MQNNILSQGRIVMHSISDAQAKRNLKACKKAHRAPVVNHNHRLDNTVGCQILMKQGIKKVDTKQFYQAIDAVKALVKEFPIARDLA